MTVWLGILDVNTGHIVASNAGHEYPVLKQGDSFEMLNDDHGVPEATSADEEMFGTVRTVEALNRDPKASPQQMLENVKAAVDAFVKGSEQFDDLTMLAIEYKGK